MASEDTNHDCHRSMAIEMFNHAWDLLDNPDRSDDQDRELLAAAYASWAHWRRVGTPKNFSVSDWQVSRVWAVAGDASRAAEHGAEALRLAEEHDLGPFYIGYGHEALARAAGVAGEVATRDEHLAAAEALLDLIDDDDSADLLRTDLDDIRSTAA